MYIRLEQGLYMVGGGSGGPGISNYKDCNVYLAEGEKDAFLIDGGSGLDNSLILDNIFETGCKPEKIRYLFLTHAHGDHGGGVKGLKEMMPWIKVAASPGEKRLLEEGTEEELGLAAAKKKGAYPADYVYPHCPVDLTLEEEQEIDGRRYMTGFTKEYVKAAIALSECSGTEQKLLAPGTIVPVTLGQKEGKGWQELLLAVPVSGFFEAYSMEKLV